jgi:iron complex transport system substrate-binding protein
MRIASLVPSATEMLFELGLGDDIVGVTHECDYPAVAADLPHLTRSVIAAGLSAPEIDAAVRERTEQGRPLYELDEERLAALDPELIVTQQVCEVCAVSFEDVKAAAERLPSRPEVISLDPTTLGEVLADIPRLALAADVEDEGEQLVEIAAERIDAVRDAVENADPVSVVALEWLDPVFIGGHWVPQMIEMAGGLDVLGLAGEKSRTADWIEVEAAAPGVVVSMPCGYDTERAARETLEHADRLAGLGARVAAVDASSYFSRPGPRLVDGIELMAHLLHPGLVPEPPAGRYVWLDLAHARAVA